ncbi:universal bacterial protein YeaZ [Bernardetia litoralis DSM 6794]|uniref:Universal bacterial protein YeaZ n=1 Tax=Bernardetia litoralis (strain ATCC 23117 / DSM 6794 / NBRC 15988 / NCIMB 1366 / Fx l1 / Sio-4) TaxID=880071 RepID=I4AGD8_BERLS|nr:tRNA (adenosine(37)-N6)-threonylcarbamoyltransferase complex dimerization subunit type 1 TsaB [Bernardetia litoralis]AFM03023.1 universal bacterial protein YeaZ [Bernardetia litoralis DSM 6794]
MILSIETSIHICSIALHDLEGNLLALHELHEQRKHAERLTLLVEAVLKTTQTKFSDLKAIAVGSGAGSYTGLRIGVSTAKGLCTGLDIPLIGIPSLQAWALSMTSLAKDLSEQIKDEKDTNYLICPLMDARRMEVFTAIFDVESNYVLNDTALVIDEHSFENELAENKILFFGDNEEKLNKCKAVIDNPNAIFISNKLPSAKEIGKLAIDKFNNQDFEDLAYFEPNYGKEFYTTAKKLAVTNYQ